jgi:hydrogenase-4 component E
MTIEPIIAQICAVTLFLITVGLHLTKKNSTEAILYSLQSVAIVMLLFASLQKNSSLLLISVVIVTLVVKVILAPVFFARLLRRHKIKFSASTYTNMPLTLIIIALITALTHSSIFASLTNIVPANHTYLTLAFASMLTSIFLMVNRRGAMTQLVGILSLENSIVAFSILAGLEQSPTLQLGILFDICVWIIIASVFVSMIYQHFGSLDVNKMKHLKD